MRKKKKIRKKKTIANALTNSSIVTIVSVNLVNFRLKTMKTSANIRFVDEDPSIVVVQAQSHMYSLSLYL